MPLISVDNIDPSVLSPAEFRQYKVCCAAIWCLRHKDDLSYGATRDVRNWHPPPSMPNVLDCSALIHYCFKVAGCPDPSENSNYAGNTASLWGSGILVGGKNVTTGQMRPGDVCFYGWKVPMVGGDSEHATLYVGQGKVISQGSEEGPFLVGYKSDFKKPFIGVKRYRF